MVLEHFVNLADIVTLLALLFYAGATTAILSKLFTAQGPNLKLTLVLATLAIINHALSNALTVFSPERINFSLPNVISLVSLLLAATISIIALRNKINLLLPVVYGFAALWQLIMLLMADTGQFPLIHQNIAVLLHIVLSLIAYCILVIATLYAFQVSYINWKLKSKNLAAVNHLPPLMQVEKHLFTILITGTLCLLLAQLSGFIFLEGFIGKENAHKTFLSLLSLIVYSVILWGRFKQGWRGHRVLVLTISATFLLTLAYFGSRFVREFIIL